MYEALDEKLRSGGGGGSGFFFGSSPCSLDAVLFSHLLIHTAAPVAAPELRAQVGRGTAAHGAAGTSVTHTMLGVMCVMWAV